MGWSVGYDSRYGGRDIGYGVPALCDHPDCNEEIDRGLSYVCSGQEPYGGADGCGLYFCPKHSNERGMCERCVKGLKPFEAKPDLEKWIHHKQTDPSWVRMVDHEGKS